MNLDSETNNPEPAASAVRCGRAVIGIIGLSLFFLPLLFSFADPDNRPYLAAALMGLGLILIWLCWVLPSRLAAHLGFWAPARLPDE